MSNMLLILRYNEGCMKRMCRFCHYFFTINTTCVMFSIVWHMDVVDYISELLQNTLCNLCFFIFTNFHVLRIIVKVDVFFLKNNVVLLCHNIFTIIQLCHKLPYRCMLDNAFFVEKHLNLNTIYFLKICTDLE